MSDELLQKTPDERNLTINDRHAHLVNKLAKPGGAILDDMGAHQAHQLHMVLGIAGEAGELLDAIKKNGIYQKPLDRENVVEELGDLEFYLQGLRASLDISREETLEHNISKLTKRYHKGSYSDQQAQQRADKQ